ELVCLAGFMRVLTPAFVERWQGRMLNIHPALLPAFPGLDTHERALAAGVKIHGCTVHLVVPEVDSGPILAQAAVPVFPGDTPDTLGARVLAQEHVIYPAALARLARSLKPDGAGPAQVSQAQVGQAQVLIVPAPSTESP
ncbi:MAG: phosphoribosylglycinamide formyltransferase, partial [Methylacidiphilales bacterium]|nr:phosphoribosylglycinamide formyltransferase [Candidatus Methylacidiphilales bacterium]